MRKVSYIFLLALLLAACGGWRDGDRLLSEADGLLYSHPDSAQRLLDSIPDGNLARMSQAQRMRYELLRADAQNKRYVKFTTDSVLKEVVEYYDRKGTANERMRANYLLGRAYYDMGEIPMALKYYHEAADQADTTQIDCDYKLLSRVHGQMGRVLLSQTDPRDAAEELQKGTAYARIANDTLMALSCLNLQSCVYEMMGDNDSAVSVAYEASRLYDLYGYHDLAAMAVGPIIDIIVKQGKKDTARQIIERYESVPSLFDKDHHITKGREIYYAVKGDYYLEYGAIDSSMSCFRLLVSSASTPYHLECGYDGLSRAFQQQGNLDSACYYSRLAYSYKDSTYHEKTTEAYQRSHAFYNYTRSQQVLERRTREIARVRFNWLLTSAVFVISLIIAVTVVFFLNNRNKDVLRKQQGLIDKNRELEYNKKELEISRRELTSLLSLSSSENERLSEQLESYSHESQILYGIIAEKRKSVEEKQRRISLLEAQLGNTVKDTDRVIRELPIVVELKNQLKHRGSSLMSEKQWNSLRTVLGQVIPDLPAFLADSYENVRPEEEKVLYLTRSFFRNGEIAILTDMNPSTISMIKKRMQKHAFGMNGGAKNFDAIVMDFN